MSEIHRVAHMHNLERTEKIRGRHIMRAFESALSRHAIVWDKKVQGTILEEVFRDFDLMSKNKDVLTFEEFFDIVAENLDNFLD